MNTYFVGTIAEERPSSMGLSIAAIENKRVIELRYLEEILGCEYDTITRDSHSLSEDILNQLCFHPKTQKVCQEFSELTEEGEVCFGVLKNKDFIEL